VIESFRNDLYAGYKTGEGIAPELLGQFELVERAAHALGLVVWSMVEFEADDALAAGAHRWADADGVEQVVICTPDKDLRQCVRGTKVVCLDRRQRVIADEAAVRTRYGIGPGSIPDWLALVGDTSDGYPGLPRGGEKSASAVLARYTRLEDIPDDHREWEVDVRGSLALAASIREHREEAMLFRVLATLRTDVPLTETLDDLRWRGGRRAELVALCDEIGEPEIANRMPLWRD
jgi:5'-3' exonuclease